MERNKTRYRGSRPSARTCSVHILAISLALLLAACAAPTPREAASTPALARETADATAVVETLTAQPAAVESATAETAPTEEAAATEVALAAPTAPAAPVAAATLVAAEAYDPNRWGELPVLPELSPRAVEVLRAGLAQGRSPNAFSKIGDCESQADWFLASFDFGPQHYALGEWEAELAPVVTHYAGSFERTSLAARPGFTAASLLSPIWADRKQCEKNETPLACEYRLHRPLVAFIMIGTNDASNPKTFEGHMRKVIEYSLEQGVLPVLGTKADNVEGDHRINATIARLAVEYDLPLWNYWAAVQDLPGGGLQEDGVHLTFAAPYFDNPQALRRAWPVRNLNALQILRRVMDATPPTK